MGARVRTSTWRPVFFPLPQEFMKDVKEAMSDLGIDHLAQQPVRILSGGQQRRVATAKSVAQRPKILLADEFLGELDDDNVDVVMQTVKKTIAAQHSALIMVEHHEELAKEVANRIWRISDHRLIEELER